MANYIWSRTLREDTPKEYHVSKSKGRQFQASVSDGTRAAAAILTQNGLPRNKVLWMLDIIGYGEKFQNTTCNYQLGEQGTKFGVYVLAGSNAVANQSTAADILLAAGWLPSEANRG